MARISGIYYLPSPPMPLVPGTLAAAEDLNVILQDIAAAITGSFAVDGSTHFTGPVNFNGQNVGGIGNLAVTGSATVTGNIGAAGIGATSFITAPTIGGTNVEVTGEVRTTGGRIISTGSNNTSVCVLDPVQGFAAGMFLGASDGLDFGRMDGQGNYVGPLYMSFEASGACILPGSVYVQSDATVAGTLTVSGQSNLNAIGANSLWLAGDIALNGHTLRDAAVIASGDLQMQGHNILNTQIITTPANQLSVWGNLDMSGRNIVNANEIHCAVLYTNAGTYAATLSQPLAAVHEMATKPVGELDLGETLATLIAAVDALAHEVRAQPV